MSESYGIFDVDTNIIECSNEVFESNIETDKPGNQKVGQAANH